MPLQLDYYYGNEAEQYSFYRIPKLLFTDTRFEKVSVEAKVLYGLLLDRMALSVKNNWLDGEGRVYIIFTIADVMETLGCAEQKANKLFHELDSVKGVGLIERVRRGLGKPNVIYVKNFIDKSCPEPSQKEPQQEELQKSQIKNCENHKSGTMKITNQELRKSQTNNTYLNNTDFNNTNLSIYPGKPVDFVDNFAETYKKIDGKDTMDIYRELIKENISYDILLADHPYDKERLDGFVELMAETCCSNCKTIRINQSDMCTEVVKSRFLKLDSQHIRYVMDSLDKNTTLIGNIRAYTLSVLFNAPVTISQYYSSLVSHDMANGFGAG
ncbi:MAG: replication initiator protein A [Lachnospiraceae bacterium]